MSRNATVIGRRAARNAGGRPPTSPIKSAKPSPSPRSASVMGKANEMWRKAVGAKAVREPRAAIGRPSENPLSLWERGRGEGPFQRKATALTAIPFADKNPPTGSRDNPRNNPTTAAACRSAPVALKCV
jgi:hypothetical protein